MSTVRDIITDALLEIGVIAPVDAIEAEDAASGLRMINRMISSWANDDLMVYTVDRQVFSLVSGQQFYTIGVGGDFVTTYPVRPGQIDMASVLVSGGTVEVPISILNDEQWRDTTVKQTPSSYPLAMWSNGNYPLNSLAFWPVPQAVNSVVLYLWGQISAFPDVNATIALPQGYEDALVYNLALRLAPGYGKAINPMTAEMARKSMAVIRGMNWEPTFRRAESSLMGTHNSIGNRSRGYVID
jgi:hypothetical protein